MAAAAAACCCWQVAVNDRSLQRRASPQARDAGSHRLRIVARHAAGGGAETRQLGPRGSRRHVRLRRHLCRRHGGPSAPREERAGANTAARPLDPVTHPRARRLGGDLPAARQPRGGALRAPSPLTVST